MLNKILNKKFRLNKVFYDKNGYLILNNIIPKKNINKLSAELEKKVKNQSIKGKRGLSEPGVNKSLVHSLHRNLVVKNLCEDQNWFQFYCKTLLNTKEFIVWNAKSNLKRRWHGSVEYFHQDFQYWKEYGFISSDMMSCMIFLDDHSHLNGGMWIFPGSHKKSYNHEKFLNINSLQKNLISMRELDNLAKKKKPLSLNVKAGSCIFFHCKLIHGSSHNISHKDRRIILYQLSRSKDYDHKKILKTNNKNIKNRMFFEKKEILKRLNKYK